MFDNLSKFKCTVRDYVRTQLEEWMRFDAPFSGPLPDIELPPDDYDEFDDLC